VIRLKTGCEDVLDTLRKKDVDRGPSRLAAVVKVPRGIQCCSGPVQLIGSVANEDETPQKASGEKGEKGP